MHSLRKRGLAWLMAKGTARYERMVAPQKQVLFDGELGDVVEIGAGAGPNIRFLKTLRSYRAIEPNPYMHPHLLRDLAARRVQSSLIPDAAEGALARIPEGSVDTVISTLVLCSVNDPKALVALVKRVLRPGGRLLLLEHVGAQPGSTLCACQHCLTPVFRFLGDGCRPNRNTRVTIESGGFREVCLEEFELPLGPISPHLCGWARK
ncbi:MAG: class I SAM-dependent methyltransferase [Bryobacterales bacterium]|nr:class I SAM-dependent methyltransferase [Bryobacterales bacterium]